MEYDFCVYAMTAANCLTERCFIREATASYKSEALALQKRLQRLQSQLELLGGQTSSLIQGRRARTAAAAGAAGSLSLIEEKLVARNLEVNIVLISVCRHCRWLHSLCPSFLFLHA